MLVALLFNMTACTTNQDEQTNDIHKQIVEEHNVAGAKFYDEMTLAKEASDEYVESLLNLYLYEVPDNDIYDVFTHADATEDGDVVSDFWTSVSTGASTDTYGDYINHYIAVKNIPKTDLLPTLNTWHAMSEKAQYDVMGTLDDFSDFAFVDYTVDLHKFYSRTGCTEVTEVYKITGNKADNLAVIVTWRHGKIMDVVRLFNAT